MSGIKRVVAFVYAPLAAFYIALSYIYPTDPQTISNHHLSLGEARVVAIVYACIFIVMWLLALYASWTLKEYTKTIRDSSDGDAFMSLSAGMIVLAVFLPIKSIIKISLNYIAHLHGSYTVPTNLVITYMDIVFPLVAYMFFSVAARRLTLLARVKTPWSHLHAIIGLLSIIIATYSFVVFGKDFTLSPSSWLIGVSYDIPIPLLVFTVVAPFIFMWTSGLFSAYEIYMYCVKARGIFYRRSLRLLSIGLAVWILTSIASQYVTAVAGRIRNYPLPIIVLIICSLLLLEMSAYVMIARGVRKLRELEEV